MQKLILIFTLATSTLLLSISAFSQQYVFLTWTKDDTSHSMTVVYTSEEEHTDSKVFYDTISREGHHRDYHFTATGSSRLIPETPIRVHRIELNGLKPNTTYYFSVPYLDKKNQVEKKFRTVPEHGPLRFITGGDMKAKFDDLAEFAMRFDPHFAVLGGDMAYENGDLAKYDKWLKWLKHWEKSMVSNDGLSLPLIAAIGNHETNSQFRIPLKKAPFYFYLFAPDEKTYFQRHFGDQISFLVLDSGHIAEHGGAQAKWLEERLTETTTKFLFTVYHAPLYPSVRTPDDELSVLGRQHWLPLFDKYNITASFENHDHALKRTLPLLNGKRTSVDNGIIYFGDGCWGQEPREVDKSRWYLAQALSERHVWRVRVDNTGVDYKAIGDKGQILDQIRQPIKQRSSSQTKS